MKKGEIWLVDLPQGKGHEQHGNRPALVVGNANTMTIAIPLTRSLERAKMPFTYVIEPSSENGLTETSVALVFQVGSLDDSRFTKKIGWIPKEQRNSIDELIKTMLQIA